MENSKVPSSSTSSSNPPPAPWRRRVSWAGVIAVALVLTAEIAARFLTPASARAKGFPTEVIAMKAAELDEMSRRGESVDVMFVGSSPAHFGIDPAAFQEAAGLDSAGTFNAGVNGPCFRGIHAVLAKYYLSKCRPPIVYIALTPNDLNSGSMPVRRATKHLMSLVDQSVPRFLYRCRLFDQRRRLARLIERRIRRKPARPRGTRVISQGFEDFATLPRESWDAVGRLGDFKLQGPALQCLQEFVERRKGQGLTCVLVNLPMRADWREYLGQQDYQAYLAELQRLARESDMPFLDLMDTGVIDPSPSVKDGPRFEDVVHLNAAGAKRLGAHLGAFHRRHFGPDELADKGP